MSAFSFELGAEFDKITAKLKDAMTSYRRGLGKEDEASRSTLYTQIQGLMEEEEDLYKQMELEVRGAEAGAKSAFTRRKETHNGLKAEFNTVTQDHQRTLLMAGGAGAKTAYKDAQREKLEAGQRRLEQCARTLAETEDVAEGTISELARNTQTLNDASANTKLVNQEIDDVTVVATRMEKRDNVMQNCVVM